MNDSTPAMHVQIAGDLPWAVIGLRTYEQDPDLAPDIVAVYGPVPTREDAETLARALAEATPGVNATAKFEVLPIYPVVQAPPAGRESAVVA